MKERLRRGFTLIELMVVISIIALIFAIISASLSSSRARARDAKRVQDLHQISTALELYFDDNGKYPDASPSYTFSTNAGWDNFGGLLSSYITIVSPDPVNRESGGCASADCLVYKYCTLNSQATKFILMTRLEASPELVKTNPPGACLPGTNLYWVTNR